MTSYVAFLRGIAPLNPNMQNEKLRGVFAGLGFQNVRTVISSGNVLFDTGSADTQELEARIEQALPEQLGFTSTTIIRCQADLQKLLAHDPFKDAEHSAKTNLNVTFLKTKPTTDLTFPYQPPGKTYTLLGLYDREICSMIDLTGSKTPDLMVWLERKFGKAITTRTYKTVQRIVAKLADG